MPGFEILVICVRTLVFLRQQGASKEKLLRNYLGLNYQALEAAWLYYEQHIDEIDQLIYFFAL